MTERETELFNKFVKDGKIVSYPGKKVRTIRPVLYEYLITKFDVNKEYTEKEITQVIIDNILFNDYVLVRREMVEQHLLSRYTDGTKYWVNKDYQKKYDI